MSQQVRQGAPKALPRVLFVEDDLALSTLVAYINAMEFECVQAPDMYEAFVELAKDAFDLVLVDIMMAPGPLVHLSREPLEIGLKFIDELQRGAIPQCKTAKDVPVIVVTGVPSDAIVERCRELVTAANVYEKPFRPRDVVKRMRELLSIEIPTK